MWLLLMSVQGPPLVLACVVAAMFAVGAEAACGSGTGSAEDRENKFFLCVSHKDITLVALPYISAASFGL